jgi:hypothetical protein
MTVFGGTYGPAEAVPFSSSSHLRGRVGGPPSFARLDSRARLSPHEPSNLKHSVHRRGLLGFEEGDGCVVDGDAGGGAAVELAVVGGAMDDQVGAVTVDYFGQARGAEERVDFRGLAVDGGDDGRVVNTGVHPWAETLS